MPADSPRAISVCSRPLVWTASALLLSLPSIVAAQTDPGDVSPFPPATASMQTSTALAAARDEAKRYLVDAKAIFTSPLHWDSGEWARAGAFVAALAILGRKDTAIDTAVQRNRSSRTDAVSSAVTPLGS
jgi:hypothetical protein